MNKEYKLSVPLGNNDFRYHMNKEKTVEVLKEMGVSIVFLAVADNSTGADRRKDEIDTLKYNTEYLHNCGFEVGAWFWAFYNTLDNDFVRMVSPLGKVSKCTVCPTDESYCGEMSEFLKECALSGVDLIQFDDDFRYGFQDIGFGCLCDDHLNRIREYLGENADRDAVVNGIMKGGKNKYRDAFIAVNGAVFEEFAKKCRKSVDEVAPSVRMGFCSCITSWDIDGTVPDKLSRILAGNTRPFYRLIGAPYWAAMGTWGHTRLSYVIEQERLEASRREDSDIEIYSEGDTYPRPRYRTPAAYLEGFDTVLRADGCTDGILKYSFDYTADYDYETGYNEAHIRNKPVYEAIDSFFSDKDTVGVRVYDNMTKFNSVTMPYFVNDPEKVQELAFSSTARFLVSNSIPTVYSGNEYSGAAFGEDARIITDEMLSNGLIIDHAAALILNEKGIDTGFLGENGIASMSTTEYYSGGERLNTQTGTVLYKAVLSEKAVVESYIIADGIKIPVFYRYENEKGQKFSVYTFDVYTAEETVYRNYERQKQLINAIEWMCGKKLPAVCPGHPDLYILTKKRDNMLSVGMWNFFPDKIYSPVVQVEEEILSFRTFGAEGRSAGSVLHLSEIEPYGFAVAEIELKK